MSDTTSTGDEYDRADFELAYPGREPQPGLHWAWESAIGSGWKLTAWVVTQDDQREIARRLVNDHWCINPAVFDPVVAATAVAVIEQAFRQNSSIANATLAGVIERLGELAESRHRAPMPNLPGDPPDDLRDLLLRATPQLLQEWEDLARRIVGAHITAHSTSQPSEPTVGDRLPHCPRHWGAAALTHARSRRSRDVFIHHHHRETKNRKDGS